ncbi:hypothetical protein K440DRAFT_625191 [Wilcoxina mikolae CBS 423.85]|nr:hypothetical protein K440DRAFT_625191 [Wilcoxina mikolae CBS 423.85]
MLILYSYHQFSLLGLFLLSASVFAKTEPLSFPWTNYTAFALDTGISGNRGIPVYLAGYPMMLRETNLFNNTRVRNTKDCSGDSEILVAGCEGSSGSSFQLPAESKGNANFVSVFDMRLSETTTIPTANPTNITKTNEFPIAKWSNWGSTDRSALGMGSSSIFLQKLADKRTLPRWVWGLLFGSPSKLKDTAFVIDKCDQSRAVRFQDNRSAAGAAVTAQSPCMLQMIMEKVILTFSNGTQHSLLPDPARVPTYLRLQSKEGKSICNVEVMKRFNILTKYEPPNETSFAPQVDPQDTNHRIENITAVLNINNHEFHETVIPSYGFSQQSEQESLEGRYEIRGTFNIRVIVEPAKWDYRDTANRGGVFMRYHYERKLFSLTLAKHDEDDHTMLTARDSTSQVEVTITAKGSVSGWVVGIIIIGLLLALGAAAMYCWLKWWNRKMMSNSGRPSPGCDEVREMPRQRSGQSQYELEAIAQPRSELPERNLVR